ncbi:winged helix-turn-helix domain-containing protein [Vibrio comitans]|uniref:DNA-binding transcriptional activator CadC n=1 Tax=Vibrio comitans NBRC 102076 TaxID=1219078 RepID=A0A4Y3IKI7_9VIBR|nr:winged helix-turn-helix domain-containing protein [Vibrio comitans]GEA59244.1 DNA-binding transcriptional activator CadC [Vibrio comitans NBRC 102076]
MPDKNISFIVDEWRFVPNEGQIQFSDSIVTIDNRLTKLLEFLCQNPGLTHTRDELIDHVWGGTVLTDQAVTQAVFELRKLLKQHSVAGSSYIVTVTKRGYRFDGEVSVEKLDIKKPDSSKIALPNESALKPEKPIDKNEQEISPPKQPRIALTVLSILVVILTGLLLFQYQTDQPTTQGDNKHLSHYEFRYAVLNVGEDVKAKPELYGMVIKLVEHIGFYSNVRIVKSERHKQLAALEFNISTTPSRDGKKLRLLVQYRNRVSDQLHLNRRYSTNFSRFNETFTSIIDDLLRAMYIGVSEEEIQRNIGVFPENSEATRSLMAGTGMTYIGSDFDGALKHFRHAKTLAPNNAYTIAVNYIGEVLNAFTKDESERGQIIQSLNQEFSSSLAKSLDEKSSAKVCEANAILALANGDAEMASKVLFSIPYNQYTPLTYLLMAKAEEAQGHIDAAKELYLQGTQNTSSPTALELASPLFFDSNLDSLINELKSSTEKSH